MYTIIRTLFFGFSVILLAACSQNPNYNSPQTGSVIDHRDSRYSCRDCGVVTAVEPVGEGGVSKGAGAVIGAVIGGVLGHQVGGGSGKDIATGAGAIGGAVAGSEVAERSKGNAEYYKVTVDMAVGGVRVVNVEYPAGLTVGTQVQVVGNDLHIVE